MTETQQTTLAIDTKTEVFTKTVKLPLQTSQRKNAIVREAIDDWQEVAGYTADVLVSFDEEDWNPMNTHLIRHIREAFEDVDLSIFAHDRDDAAKKVVVTYKSWSQNNKRGAHPKGRFGAGDYLRMCSCSSCTGGEISETTRRYAIRSNDRGLGMWLKFHRGGGVWFHVEGGEYQNRHLKTLLSGKAGLGNAELHLHADGSLYCHLSLRSEIEVYHAADMPRTVGVRLDPELGTLYAAAVVGKPIEDPESGSILLNVDHQTGKEFRHHLARIDEKHSRLHREGKLREAKACSGERRRYTDHVTHAVSRSVVDFAKQYEPCAIQLDNLTQYRDDLQEVQHGWPYSGLREKIAYKATEAGLPVTIVGSNRFGGRCSRCGESDQTTIEGAIFTCDSCGYEVHSKVNEAVNIAIESKHRN